MKLIPILFSIPVDAKNVIKALYSILLSFHFLLLFLVYSLRCVQRSGDMVVLPEDWGHLTYNIATSVGLAKEFTAHAVTKSSKKKQRNKDETSAPSSSSANTRIEGKSKKGSSSSNGQGSSKKKRSAPINIKQEPKKGAPMPPVPTSPEDGMQQRVEAAAREWADNKRKQHPQPPHSSSEL